jgi:hypothetical protein
MTQPDPRRPGAASPSARRWRALPWLALVAGVVAMLFISRLQRDALFNAAQLNRIHGEILPRLYARALELPSVDDRMRWQAGMALAEAGENEAALDALLPLTRRPFIDRNVGREALVLMIALGRNAQAAQLYQALTQPPHGIDLDLDSAWNVLQPLFPLKLVWPANLTLESRAPAIVSRVIRPEADNYLEWNAVAIGRERPSLVLRVQGRVLDRASSGCLAPRVVFMKDQEYLGELSEMQPVTGTFDVKFPIAYPADADRLIPRVTFRPTCLDEGGRIQLDRVAVWQQW